MRWLPFRRLRFAPKPPARLRPKVRFRRPCCVSGDVHPRRRDDALADALCVLRHAATHRVSTGHHDPQTDALRHKNSIKRHGRMGRVLICKVRTSSKCRVATIRGSPQRAAVACTRVRGTLRTVCLELRETLDQQRLATTQDGSGPRTGVRRTLLSEGW